MKWEAIALVALVLLAFVAFSGCNTEPQNACTEEAKVCPDGTTVARNPELNCAFDPCPEEVINTDDIPMPTDTGETDEVPELPL